MRGRGDDGEWRTPPPPLLRAPAHVGEETRGRQTMTRAGRGRRRLSYKAPPTTATSNCLWGGKGCYVSGTREMAGWRQ
jgi:hypothetical protein